MFVNSQLNVNKSLPQTTQFSISTILVDTLIGLYQVLPFWTRIDVGAMAIKDYSAFLKFSIITEASQSDVLLYPVYSLVRGSFRSTEMQSAGLELHR